MRLMVDHRLLRDPVDLEDDLVKDAARDDLDAPSSPLSANGMATMVLAALP